MATRTTGTVELYFLISGSHWSRARSSDTGLLTSKHTRYTSAGEHTFSLSFWYSSCQQKRPSGLLLNLFHLCKFTYLLISETINLWKWHCSWYYYYYIITATTITTTKPNQNKILMTLCSCWHLVLSPLWVINRECTHTDKRQVLNWNTQDKEVLFIAFKMTEGMQWLKKNYWLVYSLFLLGFCCMVCLLGFFLEGEGVYFWLFLSWVCQLITAATAHWVPVDYSFGGPMVRRLTWEQQRDRIHFPCLSHQRCLAS